MNTWRTADPEAAISIINALTEVPWPQTEPATIEFLKGLGWTLDENGVTMVSNLGVSPGDAMVVALKSGEVTRVSFDVCDIFQADEAETKADFVQDLFAEFAARFRQEWGKPHYPSPPSASTHTTPTNQHQPQHRDEHGLGTTETDHP